MLHAYITDPHGGALHDLGSLAGASGFSAAFAINASGQAAGQSDEIGYEVAESFRHAGGEALHRCPCLNDHPTWIRALQTIILEEGKGWL